MNQKHFYIIRQKTSLESAIRCGAMNAIARRQLRKVSFIELLFNEFAIQEAEQKLARLELNLSI